MEPISKEHNFLGVLRQVISHGVITVLNLDGSVLSLSTPK